MSDRDLIWVDKEFAERWKKLESESAAREIQDKVFNDYMESVQEKIRSDFKTQLESLEEESAMFAGLMLKVKQAFGKAAETHLNASYELWEKYDAEVPNVNKKINGLIDTLKPLEAQLRTVNDLLANINTCEIERLNESLSLLANNYGRHKEMIEFLITNFRVCEK